MKLKFQLMKNFNIILIACLAFIFLSSSGCSKEEDSPYTREQIIGKWFVKSYWKIDESGNGKWINNPEPNPYYFQFNANGTFYNYNSHDNTNSSWELKGEKINCKTTSHGSSLIRYYNFEIESINNKEIIANYKIDNDFMEKIKLIKDTTQEIEIYTEEDVIGKWIYKSEFKDGKWVDEPNFGYYYNIFKEDGKFLTQQESPFDIDSWKIKENTIECIIYNYDYTVTISYKIESIKENIMIVIRLNDNAKLKYIKE